MVLIRLNNKKKMKSHARSLERIIVFGYPISPALQY